MLSHFILIIAWTNLSQYLLYDTISEVSNFIFVLKMQASFLVMLV